jgi:cysteine-rich repeat protein
MGSVCSGDDLVTCGYIDSDICVDELVTTCVHGCINGACSGSTQCSNGIDDDGDKLIDYLGDPGCSAKIDDTEQNTLVPTYRCGDGIIGIPAWAVKQNCYGIIAQCDDNNTVSGDGCSSTCQNETLCSLQGMSCSVDANCCDSDILTTDGLYCSSNHCCNRGERWDSISGGCVPHQSCNPFCDGSNYLLCIFDPTIFGGTACCTIFDTGLIGDSEYLPIARY